MVIQSFSSASLAASPLEWTPIFSLTLARWRLTVPWARYSDDAIRALERPRADRSSTSSSLAESTPSSPFRVTSSMEGGIPTTASAPSGSSTAARTVTMSCSVESLLSR
jgi:hypothetical protein